MVDKAVVFKVTPPEPVEVKPLKGVVPPTIAVNVTTPEPAAVVSTPPVVEFRLFTVLLKLIAEFVVVKEESALTVTAPLYVCVPEVVIAPAKAAVPVTVKLEVPVELVIDGVVPPIDKDPTVNARCKSNVAEPDELLIVSKLVELPKVPELVTESLPALIVVAPVYVFAAEKTASPEPIFVMP